MADFRAFIAEKQDDRVERGVRTLSEDDLPAGDVTVRVDYSSVNYKDGLATISKGRVARISPLVPGVDLAGTVEASDADGIAVGDDVIVHGYDLGVAHHGGYAERARVPADWVVPLPAGLTARQAMTLGTAGFTAGLSVHALEARGLRPDQGPVLVMGATGGVGSVAVGILAARGYEVVAATGKADEHAYLRSLGATDVIGREEVTAKGERPLESERWAAVVDPIGGAGTAYAVRTARYGGAVAVSGLTAGTALETTVLPFILRGVALLGIDSVQAPMELRREVWQRLADELRPRGLDDELATEIGLDELEGALDGILAGQARGRTVVRVAS
jgi:acrylyl-CoA reductase (NADPH)